MWAPLGNGTFCVAKAFDYDVDLTQFAIFKLEDEDGKHTVDVKVFVEEKKEEPAEAPAEGEAAP